MNLQGGLVVTSDEAAQLLPLWETYQTLITSNTASPLELQATLVGAEQAMTPDQVQAIVNMKLTSQDMGTIFQQQGITSGARGDRYTRVQAVVAVDLAAVAVELAAAAVWWRRWIWRRWRLRWWRWQRLPIRKLSRH